MKNELNFKSRAKRIEERFNETFKSVPARAFYSEIGNTCFISLVSLKSASAIFNWGCFHEHDIFEWMHDSIEIDGLVAEIEDFNDVNALAFSIRLYTFSPKTNS